MKFKLQPPRYLRYFYLTNLFGTQRTKEILKVNPTVVQNRVEPEQVKIHVFDYDAETVQEFSYESIESCYPYLQNKRQTWINIDGLKKAEIEQLCSHYKIHWLIMEDILSQGQRPKMDEVEGVLFCLLHMLYYNEESQTVETEQISMVVGEDYIISFQEFPDKDVFDQLRQKLRFNKGLIRQRTVDYLLYIMIDLIVDNYYLVMEKIGERVELIEEDVIRGRDKRSLAKINKLRKELIVLKRNITPVRDLVSSLMRSESDLLNDRTTKYFKDVYDHTVQAHDLCENYRDIMVSLQDLYLSNVSLKMNEVMKVMAIVTCLLAPATVIGGVFGMNFDRIPYLHNAHGFWIAVSLMLAIPVWMVWVFKRRGWF
jgi:magnesium transporter